MTRLIDIDAVPVGDWSDVRWNVGHTVRSNLWREVWRQSCCTLWVDVQAAVREGPHKSLTDNMLEVT